jgi:uncharacterized protein with HEPN domain
MPRDESTLCDIVEAAHRALEFKEGMSRDQFDRDLKTQSAILHQLMVIGEAVKRLSPEFRAQFPAVPWGEIAGMRDKLIHAYDEVDLEQVWTTLDRDLPALLRSIELSI